MTSAFVLERLRADHAPALLEFEVTNRAWFARSIPDRSDAYFAEFDERGVLLWRSVNAALPISAIWDSG